MSVLPQNTDPTPWQRRMRVLTVMLVFVLIGPPVAIAVGALSLTAILMGLGASPSIIIWSLQFLLGVFAVTAPFGYIIAAVAALAAGLAVGIRQAFYRPVAWWVAALIGVGVGVSVVISSGSLTMTHGGEVAGHTAVLMISCIVATMACWAIVRGWHLPPRAARDKA